MTLKLVESINEVQFKLIKIPAGKLVMGGKHPITLRSFLMGETLITNAQWQVVMGTDPSSYYGSNFTGKEQPVVRVYWYDTQEFCQQLSLLTGRQVRLPSEAQWEYACRAGSYGKYFFGNDDNQLAQYAWYNGDGGKHTKPVKEKLPNQFGLYDILGNVWEWCQDHYTKDYSNLPSDGSPYESEIIEENVLRGGCWANNTDYCNCTYRFYLHPDNNHSTIGFRVVFDV